MPASRGSEGARSARQTPDRPSSESTTASDPTRIIEIAKAGDLVLYIQHEGTKSLARHAFRVSSMALREHSRYFEKMLGAGRFGEAVSLAAQHEALRKRYGGDMSQVSSDELPTLDIHDLGRISTVKSLDALLTAFLDILHCKEDGQRIILPVANLANLAIVADRFDSLEALKSYVERKDMFEAIDGKTTSKVESGLSEEKMRQRLLAALLLDHAPWVERYSARLIVRGLVGKEADLTAALWWDLPSRMEEELAFRRECILETIQDLQAQLLALYTSRERQCKLGYHSSAQCDSFQLGEMIRFFTRVGTLQLQGIIIGSVESANDLPTPYTGDLANLLDSLRQAPEYQIDKFHSHCGLRTKILDPLDTIQRRLHYIGIHPHHWRTRGAQYAWIHAKRPLHWRRETPLTILTWKERDDEVRDMFLATEREWCWDAS